VDHLEPVRERVKSLAVGAPPEPWRLISSLAVGGLTEVGFVDDSELILVLSWQGRGVVDCVTGEKLARDRSDDRGEWYGDDRLIAKGFGPLDGQLVRLSGIWGGGLPTFTTDGWGARSLTLEWPRQHLLLTEPRADLYRPNARVSKLAIHSEVRAFGFSYSGRTLIIATSSDLTIYSRA
jgi:hypothetical protein